jgi:hypothetical protein
MEKPSVSHRISTWSGAFARRTSRRTFLGKALGSIVALGLSVTAGLAVESGDSLAHSPCGHPDIGHCYAADCNGFACTGYCGYDYYYHETSACWMNGSTICCDCYCVDPWTFISWKCGCNS